MTDRIEIARRFLNGLSTSDETVLQGAMSATPQFVALGAKLSGADDVLARIARQPTRDLYRAVAWEAPELRDRMVRAIGRMPEGAARSGVVLTLQFEGNRIAVIQHQHLPPRPASHTALKLTPSLKQLIDNALATRHPMLMAYCDENDQPVMSFRGSTQAFSDDQIALWIRNTGGPFLTAIQRNPRVALMYRDEDSKATYQFQGRARITQDTTERARIYDASPYVEQAHDFARMGAAVLIDLDRIEGYAGLGPSGQIDKVLMVRGT